MSATSDSSPIPQHNSSQHDRHQHDKHQHQGSSRNPLAHHFHSMAQQLDAAKIGMWFFLAQEILFFSGLFVAYGIYRSWYPEAFSAGSHLLDRTMGAANTVVLLFSSLTVALSIRSIQLGKRSQATTYLVITILCACFFMVVKYMEYSHKFHVGYLPGIHFSPTEFPEGIEAVPYATRSFFGIYFMMTGVHGLHVLVGIGLMVWLIIKNNRGDFTPEYYTPVEMVGLYWHLVDLIWIYLFPLLYLID